MQGDIAVYHIHQCRVWVRGWADLRFVAESALMLSTPLLPRLRSGFVQPHSAPTRRKEIACQAVSMAVPGRY